MMRACFAMLPACKHATLTKLAYLDTANSFLRDSLPTGQEYFILVGVVDLKFND